MRGEAIDKILIEIISGCPTQYVGVFCPDELFHTFTPYSSAYVAKSDPSSLTGQNWVEFYQLSLSHLEFIVSYGCLPEDYHFPTIVIYQKIVCLFLRMERE